MKQNVTPIRVRRAVRAAAPNLLSHLSERVIGQQEALQAIVPFVHLHQANLSPEGRPAGIFLLLGPTGTGKTRTVEALAEVLHGSSKHVLRVDCGEYQMDHEVAKLIGAPPGYLGHRETQPLFTQARINSVASEKSGLSLILFDEVEKAAPSLTRLLLGILDKACLRLGDNTTVNFERCLIFLTSNVGARQMMDTLKKPFGFNPAVTTGDVAEEMSRAAQAAARKAFAPEFLNRVDSIVTYRPLKTEAAYAIVDLQMHQMQQHLRQRMGSRAVSLLYDDEVRDFFVRRGTSEEYGARELRRLLQRHLLQPLASMLAEQRLPLGGVLPVRVNRAGDGLDFQVAA